MAFRRYDGFVGSAPQKKMDNGLPKCPFCGEHPHWLLDVQPGFAEDMTCMCEKCGAKLYSENRGISFDNNLRIIDVGSQNLNQLPLNAVYHIKTLNTIAEKTFYTGEQRGASRGSFEPAQNTAYSTSHNEHKSKKIATVSVVIFVISIILFIGTMIWIFFPSGNNTSGNELDVVKKSSMQV